MMNKCLHLCHSERSRGISSLHSPLTTCAQRGDSSTPFHFAQNDIEGVTVTSSVYLLGSYGERWVGASPARNEVTWQSSTNPQEIPTLVALAQNDK